MKQSEDNRTISATNTKSSARKAPSSLDLTNFARKRKYPSAKFPPVTTKDGSLSGIIEECEYDSDLGKFRCFDTTSDSEQSDSLSSVQKMNDLNAPPTKSVNKIVAGEENIVENVCDVTDHDDGMSHYQIVMQRIEFFENAPDKLNDSDKLINSEELNNLESSAISTQKEDNVDIIKVSEVVPYSKNTATKENRTLSQVLFTIFMLALALLIVFPLPN